MKEGSEAHHKLVTKAHREIEEEHNLESLTIPTTMPLDVMGRLHPKQFYLENYLSNVI